MPRRVVLLVLLAVYTLVGVAGLAGPAQAQADEPVGQVTLRWMMTVQGNDTLSREYQSDRSGAEEVTDQLTLVYEGMWTWQVTRDDAGVERLEMDEGKGRYNVSGSGGGSRQAENRSGPKGDWCPKGRGGYWVPVTSKSSSRWSYQAKPGPGGHAYVTLYRQGDEMGYRVSWDWDQEITIDGSMVESGRGCASHTDTEQCGTSTIYGTCPGAGGAQAWALAFVLGQAMPAWEEQEVLRGKVRPKEWGFSVSGRATYSPEPMVESQTGEDHRSVRTLYGSAALEYTLTYEREPCDLEAVMMVPFEGEYEKWQPEAGRDEGKVGNQLRVAVELRYKDRPEETPLEKATFRFRLIDTSREPGVCLNAPRKGQTTFDLKIDADSNPDLELDENEGDQAAATKEPARGAGVTISCYDWGAYGRLQVTATIEGEDRTLIAHLEGKPEKEVLTIPLDDNGNHIADSWEENEGVLSENLPANWDASPIPRGQWSDGDGISLYEKYRGFEFGTGDNLRHERLVALAKHIFVYDPDGIVLQTMVAPHGIGSSLPKVSQCRVRFVDDKHWTGAGAAGSDKRIVNFNSGYGHAVDQHALDVRVDDSHTPVNPPDWVKSFEAVTKEKYTEEVGDARGITYPDFSTGRDLDSPQDTLRIMIFTDNIWKAIWNNVTFHTCALPAFESAGDDVVEREVARFITENLDQATQVFQKQLARVVSHEVGHALGIDHHDPTDSGDKTCVMRYQGGEDCPPNANDRFELACYDPWPNRFCTNGADCWGHVQVSDR